MIVDKKLWERISNKKKALDKLRPFSGSALNRLKKRFDVLLTYNSNAIEGNTLNLGETRLVIEEGVAINGKPLRDHFEAVNHKKAIDIVEDFVKKDKNIDKEFVCMLNGIILNEIEDEEKGIYRLRRVYVEGACFIPTKPDLIDKSMKNFFKWFNKNIDKMDIIDFAAIMHEKFTLIHPFIDGNGRIARLLMNLVLLRKGYPPAIILRTERKKYIDTLDNAHKEKYGVFVNFIARSVDRSLSLYLDALEIAEKNKEYMSLKEAEKHCDYSQEYLSLLARKGILDAVKIERNWLTTKKAIQEYLISKRKYRMSKN